MAMACVNGARECTGCMSCQVSEEIGTCVECGDPIGYGEEYYDIEGELLHWDCLREWAEKYLR